MSIKKAYITAVSTGSGLLAWASIAAAAPPTPGLAGADANLGQVASGAGLGANAIALPTLIGRILSVILGVLGIIFVILVIYSGIQFMLAQGDKTKVADAIGNLRTAIIGLVITISAYAISAYVVNALVAAAT